MRTTEEILARIKEIEDQDYFGFERNDLIDYLPFEAAKEFLKPDVTKEQWQQQDQSKILEAKIVDYMPFAWEKANNCRGLSASRSIHHMCAWLWLLGDDEMRAKMNNYTHYGKPQLRAICEKFGLDWKQWDNGRWTNDEMSQGVSPEEVASV